MDILKTKMDSSFNFSRYTINTSFTDKIQISICNNSTFEFYEGVFNEVSDITTFGELSLKTLYKILLTFLETGEDSKIGYIVERGEDNLFINIDFKSTFFDEELNVGLRFSLFKNASLNDVMSKQTRKLEYQYKKQISEIEKKYEIQVSELKQQIDDLFYRIDLRDTYIFDKASRVCLAVPNTIKHLSIIFSPMTIFDQLSNELFLPYNSFLGHLEHLQSLEKVSLTSNNIENILNLTNFKSNVKYLEINTFTLDEEFLKFLTNLPGLEKLVFNECQFKNSTVNDAEQQIQVNKFNKDVEDIKYNRLSEIIFNKCVYVPKYVIETLKTFDVEISEKN